MVFSGVAEIKSCAKKLSSMILSTDLESNDILRFDFTSKVHRAYCSTFAPRKNPRTPLECSHVTTHAPNFPRPSGRPISKSFKDHCLPLTARCIPMGGAKAERESSTAPGEQHNTAIIGTHRLAASRASSFGAFFFWLADRNRAVSVFFAICSCQASPVWCAACEIRSSQLQRET